MTQTLTAYIETCIFHQGRLLDDCALMVENGLFAGVVPCTDVPRNAQLVGLDQGIIFPGFVDLQVNGGGGVMFNDAQNVETLRKIALAHMRLGTTALLPTLITATPEDTRAAIAAVKQAIAEKIPGIIGLHLEGPHLSVNRKGAHNGNLIRPMSPDDLAMLLQAARDLPTLKVTLAPENATLEQVQTLVSAGVIVSLGHSDANFETARAYAGAGASCVTHLFNAMSQLNNREPGLVGAALTLDGLSAGLIADGIHVHPQTIKAALQAKADVSKIYLVSDAMAVAGTNCTDFTLNGRKISRSNGKLILQDGTLAGADLELASAVKLLAENEFVSLPEAMQMATEVPASVIKRRDIGTLRVGLPANFVHLSGKIAVLKTFVAGVQI